MKRTPAELITRAGRCANASAAMTLAASTLQSARSHAVEGDCSPLVLDAIDRAQRAISAAQGATEVRRQRLLRKADRLSKDQTHE